MLLFEIFYHIIQEHVLSACIWVQFSFDFWPWSIYWTELTCKWTQFIIGDYVIQATAAPSVGVSPHHNRFLQFFLPLGILGISSLTLNLWPWHHVVLCNCFHVFGRSFVLQWSTQHTCIHLYIIRVQCSSTSKSLPSTFFAP